MAHQFTDEVLKVLQSAGWTEHREIDLEAIVSSMNEGGYPQLKSVSLALSKYGNLRCTFLNKKSGKPDDFDFDALRAMEIVSKEQVDVFKEIIHCNELCLIGTAYREHILLMMDEAGRVYGTYDPFLAKIGETIEDAIERIVLNRDFDILIE